MPFFMNECAVTFKRLDMVSNVISLPHVPTAEPLHKKRFERDGGAMDVIPTKAQHVSREKDQMVHLYVGDAKQSNGRLCMDMVEYDRLVTAGTPITKGCRLLSIAGIIVTHWINHIKYAGHTKTFSSIARTAEPSIVLIFYTQDKETVSGLKGS